VRRFPDVRFRHSEACHAARAALDLQPAPCRLSLERDGGVVRIVSDRPTFGPQPFLAIRTVTGEYRHDALDIDEPFRRWSYSFGPDTIPPAAIDRVGIGTCSPDGSATVLTWKPDTGRIEQSFT
jgi:hypothetical protein